MGPQRAFIHYSCYYCNNPIYKIYDIHVQYVKNLNDLDKSGCQGSFVLKIKRYISYSLLKNIFATNKTIKF